MFLYVFYSLLASICFAFIFNIRGKNILIASLGGGISWFIYLLSLNFHHSATIALFLAAVSVAVYAELMARIFKAPVTVFVICGILPLVPGNGMYYTMYETINGSTATALNWGLQTLMSAGAIAIAIVMVSSIAKLATLKKKVPTIK